MQEEKKKKGIWNKLKNVLFVDDDEDEKEEGLPDYNKVEEPVKKEEKPTEKEESIVNTTKDFTYEVNEEKEEEKELEKEKETEAPKEFEINEEKASPFLSFDELEFERLTSRVTRNESRVKEDVVEEDKKPTYNLPPTNKEPIFSRSTMSSVNNTNISGKKPFSPSPVISPVYGILDKNYRKDDIVDKRTDRKAELDELDRVRKKAYGSKSEKKKEEIVIEEVKDVDNKLDELNFEEIKVRKPSILEEDSRNVEEDITYKNAKKYNEVEEKKKGSPLENELNTMLDNDMEEEYVDEETTKKSPKLDDLEKTSTLRILDDIEKELNSIKPVSDEDNGEISENGKKSQIDEKDIFNMISSMYVGGDDEDDSD